MWPRALPACLLALAWTLNAAAPPSSCEPGDAIFQLLARWRITSEDARLSLDDRWAPLWKAIEAQPGNIFLHHAYQSIFLDYIHSVRRGLADDAYRKLIAAHADDLALKYAYARFLYGTRTADSKKMLEEVAAADPDFPWVHLALARVYQNQQFANETRHHEEIERFFAMCPATLAVEAYDAYSSMPQEFRVKAAAALRERLKDPKTPREFAVLPALWRFEFQSGDRAAERVRIAADLPAVRKLAENDGSLLDVALQGYNLIEDHEGARWARDRLAAFAPHSFAACNVAISRWFADRTRPTNEDSRDRVQGYYRELLEATDRWIEICPLNDEPWSARLRALRELPSEPAAKVLQTGDGLLRAAEAGNSSSFVTPSLTIGEVYEQRGIGFDRILPLIDRNQRDSEARLAADRNLDWLPASWRAGNESEAAASYMEAHVLAIRKHTHDGKPAEAARELAAAERATGDQVNWKLQPHLIDAYLAMGETAKAKASLYRLSAWLDAHQPSETAGRAERLTYRSHQADYWERAGKLAEFEKHPKEVLQAYENVLQYRANWETLAERFSLIDQTAALWKSTGGNSQAWDKWLSELTATIAVPAQNWQRIERAIPAFNLTDLTGRKWTQDDLKGKVTLINMWATWCGPCIAELPYVQKIQNAIADRKDVQVIALNVDENPGAIEPFLKQRGVTSLTVIPAMDFVEGALKVNGFPRTWVVDRDGVARREQAGFTGEPSKWVEQVVAALK